jgi:hypothetical protein
VFAFWADFKSSSVYKDTLSGCHATPKSRNTNGSLPRRHPDIGKIEGRSITPHNNNTKSFAETGIYNKRKEVIARTFSDSNYLGFKVNSKLMKFRFPKQKVKELIKECKSVKELIFLSVRKLASLIGKIMVTTCTIFLARLRYTCPGN